MTTGHGLGAHWRRSRHGDWSWEPAAGHEYRIGPASGASRQVGRWRIDYFAPGARVGEHIGSVETSHAYKAAEFAERDWQARNAPESHVRRRLLANARFRERLPGGRSSGMSPSDFDQAALRVGTEHEMEHTSDRMLAMEIAMDHLAEDPEYYEKLRRMEGNPDDEDPDELDDEIKDALEREARLDADRNACVALSTMGDQTEDELEAMGYDAKTAVVISETYDAVAVNGDVLTWRDGKVELWSDVGTAKLTEDLREVGFEIVDRLGGEWPGGLGEELSVEHLVRFVAREMKLPEERVDRVATELLGWGELVYYTSDNVDTTVWAHPRGES